MKYLIALLAIINYGLLEARLGICQSHIFVPRSITTDLVYINGLTYFNRYLKTDFEKKFTYVGQAIYQRSNKSAALGRAFLNGINNQILIAQDSLLENSINSVGLGLANFDPNNPFQSIFSIEPQRSVSAYHGYFYANLDEYWCGLWFDLATAIVNARHNLHAIETSNRSNLCPGISTVCQALNNPGLLYDKFFCGTCHGTKRRTGLDDIQLRLGYDWHWGRCALLGIYLIGTIPTGRGPTAEFIFEPLVGSKHGSIGVGLHGHYQYNPCCNDYAFVALMSDFNYRHVFAHRICRTFDFLPQGPFSRFLPLVEIANPLLTIPAVNLTTQPIKVFPRGTVQWWLGIAAGYCNWSFEIGYNLWWRQKEKIEDKIDFIIPQGLSFFDLTGQGILDPVTIASINLKSGLAARALTNKLYAAFSWVGPICNCCFEWMWGFGVSYEWVVKHDRCAALPTTAIFGKLAINF